MFRTVTLAAVFYSIAVLGGCDNASTSPMPLPPEYRVLAETIGTETHQSFEEIEENVPLTQISNELREYAMKLRGLRSSDPDIASAAAKGVHLADEILRRIDRIMSISSPLEELTIVAESFLHGLIGNLPGLFGIGADAFRKQSEFNEEIRATIREVELLMNLQYELPKIAEKYAAPFTIGAKNFDIMIAESWGWVGPHDWIMLKNNGPSLADCTVIIDLTGFSGEIYQNVHFVDQWPTGSEAWMRYEAGKEFEGRIVGKTTVTRIQTLEFTILSPSFSTKGNVVFEGKMKDSLIANYCKDIELIGRYQSFEQGFFWNTDRGARIRLDGVPFLPPCAAIVRFHGNGRSMAWRWEISSWRKGEEKTFSEKSLSFDPLAIDFSLEFPDTGYKHNVKFYRE